LLFATTPFFCVLSYVSMRGPVQKLIDAAHSGAGPVVVIPQRSAAAPPQAVQIERGKRPDDGHTSDGASDGRSNSTAATEPVSTVASSLFQFFKDVADFNPFPTGHDKYLEGGDEDSFDGEEDDDFDEDEHDGVSLLMCKPPTS
jgi:hypothetical protein